MNNDQWTTAAQDEGEGRKIEQQTDSYRHYQGCTTACNSMPERDGKDQGQDSPKQAWSC